MSHKLYDITLYGGGNDQASNKEFALKCNLVSGLYVECLGKYKPPKTSRISVTLGNVDEVGGYFGSILHAWAKFDKELYWQSENLTRNKIILDTVHRIALLCAKKLDWNIDVFQNAYNKVLQLDYKYRIELKSKMSKNRKYKAAIMVKKDEKIAYIWVNFYTPDNVCIKSVELLKSFPHDFFYEDAIKKNKWISDSEFGLYLLDGSLIIKASLENDKPETIINPINKDTKEEIKGYLRRLTYREINSQQDIVDWMNL